MSSAPTRPIEIPPFQLQPLISSLPPASHPPPPPPASHKPGGSGSVPSDFFGQAAAAPLDLFSRVTGAGARVVGKQLPPPPPPQVDAPVVVDREVRCAQALNRDLFVGCSDGSLIRYSLRDDDASSGDPYCVASQQSIPGNKAIDKIVLVPSLSKALVLSGTVIYFYTLPAFDPIPPGVISPIKGVMTFALDDNALNSTAVHQHGPPPIRLCIIRRRVVVVSMLRDRMQSIKDIPLPNGATRAKLAGSSLFIADQASYSVINIDNVTMTELMPWSHVDLEPQSRIRPSIVTAAVDEFMLVAWTGAMSLGVFFTSTGDPCRGTLEWPQHPVSICVDYPYIISLLPNGTLEIHSMETLAIVAVVPCPTTLQCSLLTFNPGGYLTPSTQRNHALQLISAPLLPSPSPPQPEPTSPSSKLRPPSGSGLTPPPSPHVRPTPSRLPSGGSRVTFTRSRTILIGPVGISGLLPSTLVSQVDSLLESARIEDAIELTEQARKALELSGSDHDQTLELELIYQRLGYECLKATRFEDAGQLFSKGHLDPRLLIRLFPDLRGSMITPSDEVDMFQGVERDAQAMGSIDEIVMANLVRNYHPHMKPSVEEAMPTAELRRVLAMTAQDMLMSYLRKWSSAGKSADAREKKVQRIVDTVLAKLYALEGRIVDLSSLIEATDDIAINELEPLLVQNKQFAILSRIYEKRNDESKLLEIWTKAVEGDWADTALQDPLPKVVNLLMECKDRVLVQRYGIWLVKRDPDAAFKLFISKDSKRGMKMDDSLILRAIRAVDARLGEQYLEHLVLNKRNYDPALHTQLAKTYLDRVVSSLEDQSLLDAWNALLSNFAARPSSSKSTLSPSSDSSTFLVNFATDFPDPELKLLRLKLWLFLQGSISYDINVIGEYLARHEDTQGGGLFVLERAIVQGKLGNHHKALSLLVRSLRDATTAESYCTVGGEVISAKTALSIARTYDLAAWGNLVVTGGTTGGLNSRSKQHSGLNGVSPEWRDSLRPPADESKRKELIKILMQVYMDGGEQNSGETARLLNSQAINLDVVDVLEAVPPSWSLNVMSSFLSRSLRRTLHDKHEGLILKNLAAAQNLEVSLESHEFLREQGAVVEEAFEGEDGDDEEMTYDEQGLGPAGSLNEKNALFDPTAEQESFSEKLGLHGHDDGQDEQATSGPKPIVLPGAPGHQNDSFFHGIVPSSVDSSRTMN